MKLPWKSSVHYFAIAGSKNGVELKSEWPDAVPDHKTSKWLAPRGRMLIQILTVDDNLDECRVVFHVGIVLCVECGQRHQQRAAAGDIHLRRGTFEWRAGRVRSERVDDVLATILINKHQRYLQHSNAHHRYTTSRESRGNNWPLHGLLGETKKSKKVNEVEQFATGPKATELWRHMRSHNVAWHTAELTFPPVISCIRLAKKFYSFKEH